ncbi:ATP-binding protein [Dyella marensis]|uniref:AAA ATPase domain-containing protein n=1 Tax=Dyella marensis TaxID=500610 RepID=A0A1I1ZX91_9GAMM|nr:MULTISPECIES: ATP-binding protein [Dyella]SFE36209.1 AAA ATPase domain-containing protein [Dyella marensis]
MDASVIAKLMRLNQAFTPGAPVNNADLFAGRLTQMHRIFTATGQRGFHVVLFGERGVGKTSLANVASRTFQQHGQIVARVTCDAGDTFTSVWRKALREITFNSQRTPAGFANPSEHLTTPLSEYLPAVANPDDVRRLLEAAARERPVIVVLDEFDRIQDRQSATLISDTIKALSDYGVNATVLIIGVADSVEQLIEGHQSIERALVQIPMPRMSSDEIRQILDKGSQVLGINFNIQAQERIIELAQGVPFVAHLLGLHSSDAALRAGSEVVNAGYVRLGIEASLDQWHESIKRDYYAATKSHQPGNIYREVLLACALAELDELGCFTPVAVREPLSQILNRDIDIANFAQHLKAFCEPDRGPVFVRDGQHRRWRYRFVSPLMRPYVVMRGYVDGLRADGSSEEERQERSGKLDL